MSFPVILTSGTSHATGVTDANDATSGIDIRPHLKTLNCNGRAGEGNSEVEVKYEDGQPITLSVTHASGGTTTHTSYELDRAGLVPAQIEIAGYAKESNQKNKGLLITIPITDLKARIWSVSGGLTKSHIRSAIDQEGTTTCWIEQK